MLKGAVSSDKVGEGSNMQHETCRVWDWRRGLASGAGGSLIPPLFWRHTSSRMLRRQAHIIGGEDESPPHEQPSQDSWSVEATIWPGWSLCGVTEVTFSCPWVSGPGAVEVWAPSYGCVCVGSPAGCPEILEGSKGKCRLGAQRICDPITNLDGTVCILSTRRLGEETDPEFVQAS